MRTSTLPGALAFVLIAATAARAQDEKPAAEVAHVDEISTVTSTTRPPGILGPILAPPVHVEVSLDHAFHTTFRDYPGDFTTTRDRVLVGTWLPLPGTFFFGLDLEVEASTYIGTWGLVFGGDHHRETLWQIDVAPKIIDQLSDSVTLYVGTGFFFAGALDAEVKDAVRYELDLATQLKLTPTVTLTLGAGIRTALEATPAYYPILGLEWSRVKVFLAGGVVKATVQLVANAPAVRELSAFASFGYDLRQYRLAEYDGHTLTPVPGGVVRDTRYPLNVGAAWKPITGVTLDVHAGANFWQKIEIDDHLGRSLGRGHARPAPLIGFQLTIDI